MIQCEVMEDLGLLGLNNIQHITVITYNSSFYRSCYCIFIFILLHKHTIEYFPQRSINRISHYPFYILKLLFDKKILLLYFFDIHSKAIYSVYLLHNSTKLYLYHAIAFRQKQKYPQHIHRLDL